jgi:hypothetical protein
VKVSHCIPKVVQHTRINNIWCSLIETSFAKDSFLVINIREEATLTKLTIPLEVSNILGYALLVGEENLTVDRQLSSV